jgi:hypothetical protein
MEYMNNSIYNLVQTRLYYESIWLKTECMKTFGGSPPCQFNRIYERVMGSVEKSMYGLA